MYFNKVFCLVKFFTADTVHVQAYSYRGDHITVANFGNIYIRYTVTAINCTTIYDSIWSINMVTVVKPFHCALGRNYCALYVVKACTCTVLV